MMKALFLIVGLLCAAYAQEEYCHDDWSYVVVSVSPVDDEPLSTSWTITKDGTDQVVLSGQYSLSESPTAAGCVEQDYYTVAVTGGDAASEVNVYVYDYNLLSLDVEANESVNATIDINFHYVSLEITPDLWPSDISWALTVYNDTQIIVL